MLIFLLRLCYTSSDTASEINKFVTKTLNILKRIHKEEPCTFDSKAFEITQNDDVSKITEVNNQCNKFISFTDPYKIISKDSDIIYLLHSRILFLEKILKSFFKNNSLLSQLG
ncbi:hypothetical protein TUBRATIS_22410 [Tubulinosema ratisbonensis]|uniref:Uncharacterized protein n=1 Tax=Tubulinosema ratisbonensis TaxID=291195 RepID=A0A437AJE6_9MICR|nr:hypothetical protein TUBRATIS_22410 [Tubulinosema ratisbonensis]